MSDSRFLPYEPERPEDARPHTDRITPILPPPPDEPVQQIRVVPSPNAWERQPGEGEEDWAKFLAYRDSSRPRRVVRPGIGNWGEEYRRANEWKWFQRVEALDNHVDRIRQKEIDAWNQQNAKEVAAEHMSLLKDAREIVAIELHRILERVKVNQIDGSIKPTEVFKLAEIVLKFDRLLRNQTTENVGGMQISEANLEEMSLEDLRTAHELTKKMRVGG